MTDMPDPLVTISELRTQDALLRGSLFLTARALKSYHDTKHIKTSDPELRQLTVPVSFQVKATDALARADNLLRDQGRGR